MTKNKRSFNNHIIIGFGSIGRGLLPVLFQEFNIIPSQITIIDANEESAKIAQKYQVNFELNEITSKNYQENLSILGQ